MLHMVMDEAKRRNRKIGMMFIDWECQIGLTIDFAKQMFDEYSEWIERYWVALPVKTWNACSQIEPEWTAWDNSKRDLWVRQPDSSSITDMQFFPFTTKECRLRNLFLPSLNGTAKGKRAHVLSGLEPMKA